MKSTTLSVALCAALAGIALTVPGAFAQTTTETAPPAPAAEAPAAEPAAEPMPDVTLDTVLATVNGEPLTLGEVLTLRSELPEQYQKLPDEVLFQGLVEQMTDQMLLAQAAAKAGLENDPRVKLSKIIQNRAILSNTYLQRETEARVTPEALKELYKTTYVDAKPEQEVKAAHILVPTEEKAKEIKAEFDAGADFAELAKKYGTDGTKNRGGDLGWFVHADMVPEFADAAFAMEPGTVSDPVKTSFGWHLIKLEEKRDRQPPTYEEVEAQLVKDLTGKAQLAIVTQLRGESEVTSPEAKLPPAVIRQDKLLDGAGG